MKRQPQIIAAGLLLAVSAFGQPVPTPDATSLPPEPTEAGVEEWALSASAYAYFVPDDDNYVQPTLVADRGRVHLEARHNYEAPDTSSVWLGYNFAGGDTLAWELTPMLGGVFGETDGVAPGFKASLGWRMLEIYSEGEYFIDSEDSSENFLYNWSELVLVPAEWIRFGLVTQRTRAYEGDRDIQRGLLAGFSYRAVDVTGYLFNPDDDELTFVFALGLSF